MTNVDLDEPTPFLDRVFLRYTPRECKPNEIVVDEFRKMFESRISAGTTDKFPVTTWKDMLRNALRDCELANQKDRAGIQSLESLHR